MAVEQGTISARNFDNTTYLLKLNAKINSLRTLKIHTDEQLILPEAGIHWLVRPLLNPSLTEAAQSAADNSQFRPFDSILFEYNRIANDLFTLSSLEDCDLAVVPINWEEVRGGARWLARSNRHWVGMIRDFAAKARRAGKPVVIFFSEDRSHEPVPVPGAVVFRHAIYRSRRTKLDLTMPDMIYADLAKGASDIALKYSRKWQPEPVVGFCGFSRKVTPAEKLQTLLAYKPAMLMKFGHLDISPFRGIELRHTALSILKDSTVLRTNFVIRDRSGFLAKDESRIVGKDHANSEYFRNIIESDYQCCVRGSANFSRRPWETMCCGRSPLFVDTDCVLPFENQIDWNKYMAVIAEADLEKMPDLLRDFHATMRADEYVELQLGARRLWEEWLTPHGFATQLNQNFDSLIARPSQLT